MTEPRDGETTAGALTMSEVRRLLGELDAETFERRLGHAFLLYYAPTDPTAGASFLGRTVVLESPPDTGEPAVSETLIFPVRPSGRSPFPNFISVGRAAKNDVIIPDASLSKFHAYFRQDGNSGYSLLDAGSQNGTFLDDEPVPSQKEGEPMRVQSGSRLRFGAANCSFLLADALRTVAAVGGSFS